MDHRGWRRSAPYDGGVQELIHRDVGGDRYLVVELDPGIALGLPPDEAGFDEQKLSAAYLSADPDGYSAHRREPLTGLDPVQASEVLRDLTWLVS